MQHMLYITFLITLGGCLFHVHTPNLQPTQTHTHGSLFTQPQAHTNLLEHTLKQAEAQRSPTSNTGATNR